MAGPGDTRVLGRASYQAIFAPMAPGSIFAVDTELPPDFDGLSDLRGILAFVSRQWPRPAVL